MSLDTYQPHFTKCLPLDASIRVEGMTAWECGCVWISGPQPPDNPRLRCCVLHHVANLPFHGTARDAVQFLFSSRIGHVLPLSSLQCDPQVHVLMLIAL